MGVTREYIEDLAGPLNTDLTPAEGAGRPVLLSVVHQLTFLFLWMKNYLSGELLGFFGGMSRSSASSYARTILDSVHNHYRMLDLIRFAPFAKRAEQGVWFQGWLLTTVIDCTEQVQLDSTGCSS